MKICLLASGLIVAVTADCFDTPAGMQVLPAGIEPGSYNFEPVTGGVCCTADVDGAACGDNAPLYACDANACLTATSCCSITGTDAPSTFACCTGEEECLPCAKTLEGCEPNIVNRCAVPIPPTSSPTAAVVVPVCGNLQKCCFEGASNGDPAGTDFCSKTTPVGTQTMAGDGCCSGATTCCPLEGSWSPSGGSEDNRMAFLCCKTSSACQLDQITFLNYCNEEIDDLSPTTTNRPTREPTQQPIPLPPSPPSAELFIFTVNGDKNDEDVDDVSDPTLSSNALASAYLSAWFANWFG